VLKLVLLVVLLALAETISGCQEGYAHQNKLTNTRKVALEPSVTGFIKQMLIMPTLIRAFASLAEDKVCI
jgi:hypothetical protein